MSIRLEKMLVDEGLLSEEQFNQLQNTPRPHGLKVQDYILREGLVADTDMVSFLSDRLHIPKYDPFHYPVDPELAAILPASMAGKHRMVPLRQAENLLIVAMSDPTEVVDIDTVQRHVKMEVEPVICTETEYNELMNSLYGLDSGMGSLLDDIEEVDYSTTQADEESEESQLQALKDMAEGSTAVRNVNWIITRAVREGASDVHICPEKTHVQVRLRVDGVLKDLPPIPKSMQLSVISRLKILGSMDIAVTRVPQDGRFTARISGREINVRVSSLPTIYGENIVMRLLDMNALVFKLDQLGMRESDVRKIEQTIARPHGMILNTGPTGSGKTTTLYSVLAMLNRPEVNIITVEDPVEYRIPRIRQVELNTRAGMSFAGSLRSMLRQDPDIAMIGEIRDSETATIAIQAALTGHLVLSTVHTNNAIGTISRLIDMGIEPFLIASVLSCVIGQRLVRRVCESCAVPWSPPPEAMDFWELSPDSESRFLKAHGCHRCRHTGYRGRVGVYEVLPISENLKSLIASNASEGDLRAAAREEGNFVTMREDAAIKVQQGLTTLEEAAANVVL
ncbi:MAG: type IV pilus assembly protein PilB [Verrucomicrobiales bacterium]|jgi:type IV pilus assembly protein PilB